MFLLSNLIRMKTLINITKQNCVFIISNRYYSKAAVKKGSKYSTTLLLPETKLPLRLNQNALLERDKKILENKNLYSWQRETLEGPDFILHDGPPYANGELHIGHAINKILKDTIIRYKIIEKQRVHYIPGWDCHGLPIELKASSKFNISADVEPCKIREKARQFAQEAVAQQKQEFQQWGVIGDWDNIYCTYHKKYIKKQLNDFLFLYKRKLIFRDLKPVYWSPSSRTALAEAELEYNENHKSTAVIVKLEVKDFKIQHDYPDKKIFALIWTTTPWTLPCNQAICYNPAFTYSLVKSSTNNLYILASSLIDNLSQKLGDNLTELFNFKGDKLQGVSYQHPLDFDKKLPFLFSDHVSDDKGTGLVHTAPAHGPDDFLVALKHKIPVQNLVDELGRYNLKAGPDLNGHFVLEKGQQIVLENLKSNILHSEEYIHSYPYDWRTKKPVIMKASHQWFIDTDKIKEKAIELLEGIKVFPDSRNEVNKNVLIKQLKRRPYWCISRQRVWGVPIPVFYEKSTGKVILNEVLIKHLCDMLDKNENFDFWWQLPHKNLLPSSVLEEFNVKENDIIKSKDILDIWFDSGISWSAVLEDKVADLYLEGVDQFTGWFQSSLITSTAIKNRSPYRSLYVHGFAVDENRQKMSKSLGNVVTPKDIVKGFKGKKPFGIDVLRWWIICHTSKDSIIEVNNNILQACADEIQKIRSVLRFAVSVLNNFNGQIDDDSLQIIDKYLLHLLTEHKILMVENYENYQFNKIGIETINFLTNPVSSLYYPAVKDRLYCEPLNDPNRQAAQYVLLQIFNVVLHSIAPIVPHLAEEIYEYFPQKSHNSIFKDDYSINKQWENDTVKDVVEKLLLNVRKELHKSVGANSSIYKMKLNLDEYFYMTLQKLQPHEEKLKRELCDLLQISNIEIVCQSRFGKNYELEIVKSDLFCCERCRRYSALKEFQLCERCFLMVENINKTTSLKN